MGKTGFVGLGAMGNPMALNLIRAGHEVMVYDVRAEACREAADLGAAVAPDMGAMARCSPVFVVVNTGPQVEAVLAGIAEGLPRGDGCLAAVMSTISPDLIKDLSEKYASTGMRLLDAPVSGAPILARTGQLSIMVGGDADLFDTIKPQLDAMGTTIRHMGPLGMGLAMKLVNNLVGITNGYVLTEALKIGLAGGLDVKTMVEMIRASSGNNWIVENWDTYIAYLALNASDPRLLTDFHQTAVKDISTMLAWTRSLGMDSGVVSAALDILDTSDAMSEKMIETLTGESGEGRS